MDKFPSDVSLYIIDLMPLIRPTMKEEHGWTILAHNEISYWWWTIFYFIFHLEFKSEIRFKDFQKKNRLSILSFLHKMYVPGNRC